VVATHAHADHSAGLAAILENFRPRELWVGTNPSAALVDEAKALGIRVVAKKASPRFGFSGAEIQILSPTEGFNPPKAGNNDSLAFRTSYGSRSMLLTGDLELPMEQLILNEKITIKSDVLKVGHHGSKTSTSTEFLDAVSPSIAMISVGLQNTFGHPNPEVTARLTDHRVAFLRTDVGGTITIRTNGSNLWWDERILNQEGISDMYARGLLWSSDVNP
jgi:competence protein ComEC